MSRTGERKTSSARHALAAAHRRGQSERQNRTQPRHHLAETLESRLMLAAGPVVESINRASRKTPAIADINGDDRPDLLTTSNSAGLVSVLSASAPSFTGQTSTVGDPPTTTYVTLQGSATELVLVQDPDGSHIDWTTASSAGRMLIDDPAGFAVNIGDNHAPDSIVLDYSNGNPLPTTLHLNGNTFNPITLFGLTGPDPLAGTTLDLEYTNLFINYANSPDPLPKLLQYLKAGYNGGAWTGVASPTTGVITSAAIPQWKGRYTLGYADSADGLRPSQPPQTVEIRFTVTGDATLDGYVNATDAIFLARNFLAPGKTAWDQGNFNYDSTIDSADALLLQKNYGVTVPPPPPTTTAPPSSTNKSVSTATAGSASSTASVLSAANSRTGSAAGARSPTTTPDDATDHPRRKRGKKDKYPH